MILKSIVVSRKRPAPLSAYLKSKCDEVQEIIRDWSRVYISPVHQHRILELFKNFIIFLYIGRQKIISLEGFIFSQRDSSVHCTAYSLKIFPCAIPTKGPVWDSPPKNTPLKILPMDFPNRFPLTNIPRDFLEIPPGDSQKSKPSELINIFDVFFLFFWENLDSPIALVEAQPCQVLTDNDCLG